MNQVETMSVDLTRLGGTPGGNMPSSPHDAGSGRASLQFAEDASHALRNGLTACRGHLELLGDDPEEGRRTIALVVEELKRIERIVDDLHLLAQAEQPDFLRLERIDLTLFAHDLVAKASMLSARDWRLDRAAAGTLVGDRDQLTEAVMKLAQNAVQHTDRHDTVAIGVSLSDGEARLWVRDNGPGIPASDREGIFERFTRGRGAQRRYRGGGLGLAIVKAVAEAHRGTVELHSRVGEGSTFTIVLPRDPTSARTRPS